MPARLLRFTLNDSDSHPSLREAERRSNLEQRDLLSGAGQADRKFGEFADPAVDFDRTTVLLGDDVIADRETEPGAFAGRLCRNKRLEQFVPDLRRNAGTVVAHPHLDRVAEIARRHL
jgi:hypothetical protein